MKLNSIYRSKTFKDVKYLGIDKSAIRKGHGCMTIAADLHDGQVIHAEKGKSKSDTFPFLKRLKQHASNLETVTMDYSKAISRFQREYQRTM
jgi:transposase